MSKKALSIITAFVILAAGASWLFQESIFKLYNTTAESLHNFQKTDLGAIVDELKREILAPAPLHIGGKANNVFLNASAAVLQTNLQRKSNGSLPALTVNAQLTAAAKAKAQDMFAKQYFEHVSPSGVDPGNLVKANGYEYIITGENLILGNFKDEQEVVQLWMNSPGHRANILNSRFTEIGVALVKGAYKGDTVWIGVQEFGLPLSACNQPEVSLQNQIEQNKASLDALAVKIEAKRAEINNTSKRLPEYNKKVDEYNALVAQYNALNEKTKLLISQYNAQVNAFNACVAGDSW